ncbi:hypothetical protein EVAR_6449_1 [Eumeta japonica]|uniref:Mariner Mos1 transposase n=1 Tax=Eumeta variegata TaxID=151549 RepID=A0A4C1ST16_EUMVA|nr:hypothetical protein EVAR_6449_1 [Eumeta japonica]
MINLEWYTIICLTEVFEEINKNNLQRKLILHHDKASCHRSADVTRFLEGQKIELMGYPAVQPRFGTQQFLFIAKPTLVQRGSDLPPTVITNALTTSNRSGGLTCTLRHRLAV